MKLVFEVRSVRQDADGTQVVLQESAAGRQQLYVNTTDPKEIAHWVSRIGQKVCLTVEDL